MNTNLLDTLTKLCKSPASIRDAAEGGGACLIALALHASTTEGNCLLEADWNHRHAHEWIFQYSRKGYSSAFALHCSLQSTSGKMLVQGREADRPVNMHNLGLQIDKYIPDASKCQCKTWEGVLEREEFLDDMMREYIIRPLLRQATPAPEASHAQISRSFGWLWRHNSAGGDALSREESPTMMTGWPMISGAVVLSVCICVFTVKQLANRRSN